MAMYRPSVPMQAAPQPASTVSMDLPPSLAGIMNMRQVMPAPAMAGSAPGLAGATGIQDFGRPPMYQQGGMVGAGGQPMQAGIRPQAGGQPQMSPQMLEMQIQNFMNTRPQQMQQIQQAVMEGLQTGELTQQELNMLSQLAMAVLRNPAIYPQVRQFAINQGLATAADIPESYDEGLIFAIIVAARAAAAATGGQNMMAGGSPQAAMTAQQPIPSMQDGGYLRGPSHSQGGIPAKMEGGGMIEMEGGEYVIPRHVVQQKGREFFDKMLAQYEDKK